MIRIRVLMNIAAAALMFVSLSASYAQISLKWLRPLLEMNGAKNYEALGASLLSLGDINGDGYPDFGAGTYKPNRYYIYFGGPGILDGAPDATLEAGGENAVMGDLNGDGYKELITRKSPTPDLPDNDTIFIYFGKPGPGILLDTIPGLRIPGETRSSEFGRFMATGDLNGDGYDDLVISAPAISAGLSKSGKVYIYLGKLDFTEIPDYTGMPSEPHDEIYGFNIQISDVNGDGYDDLTLGIYHFYSMPEIQEWHKREIFHGGPGWTFNPEKPDQIIDSRRIAIPDSSNLGLVYSVTVLDLNADGIGDIFTRHYGIPDSAFIFFGRPDSFRSAPDRILINPDAGRFLCFLDYPNSIGDINGDGYGDFLLRMYSGVPYILVHQGSPRGIADKPAAQFVRLWDNGNFGRRVARIGDTNGDGVNDFCVSGPGEDFSAFGYIVVFSGDTSYKVGAERLEEPQPRSVTLGASYPNPFRHETDFEIAVPTRRYVSVMVYDAFGRETALIYEGELEAGLRRFRWNGKTRSGAAAPAGAYFYTAATEGELKTGRMILLR